ncbi:hypothetical protein GE061_011004 [Apolygus lucorum]|uniref:N-acetyltransferase domain-containing protein n=1 Tax=Apolygus lucorum TaxID=248454 RepID=A0A8S9XYV8_APOLU|nr:hypothetical protein GE061_011004 [Apolygus lucorum]
MDKNDKGEVWNETEKLSTLQNVEMIDLIKEVDPFYPSIKKVPMIAVTLPCTTCSVERTFSTLRRVKTWTRSTMREDRLNESGESGPRRLKRIIAGRDLPSHDLYGTQFLVDIVHLAVCEALQFPDHSFPDCENTHICMGSLVAPDFVLTNCHCMIFEEWYNELFPRRLPAVPTISPDDWPDWIDEHKKGSSIFGDIFSVFLARMAPDHPLRSQQTLWMGSASRNSAPQKRHSAKFFPHHLCAERLIFHNISWWQEVDQEMDIGLVKTCEPFKLNKDIKVAPLPVFGEMENFLNKVVTESRVCLVAGWGSALREGSSQFDSDRSTWTPEILQHTFRSMHCNKYCGRHNCRICTRNHGPDLSHTSSGDSGTPYICDGFVVGVHYASFSNYPKNVTSAIGVPLRSPKMVHAQTLNKIMWRLELCTFADKQAMRRLLQRTMYEDEPLASTYDESCKEAMVEDEMALNILDEGHSIKAVTEDGRIVGAAINKKCPYSLDDYEPIQHVKDFLRAVDAKKPMDCEGLLDMYMLAVDPDFRRQGMAKALGQAAVLYAKKAGFRGMKITASSQYTTNVANSLGFRVFNSVAYADYKDDAGRVVFSPPAPHTHINIMLKEFDKESKI